MKFGFQPEKLNSEQLADRFPAFAPRAYQQAIYHDIGGYAEAGRTIEVLCDHAISIGVEVKEGHTVNAILMNSAGHTYGVRTVEAGQVLGGHVIVCAVIHLPSLFQN